MSLNTGLSHQPLFTIEQIELIRRLRDSGISKEEVIHAFDALQRLDKELQPLCRSSSNHITAYKQLPSGQGSFKSGTSHSTSQNGASLPETSERTTECNLMDDTSPNSSSADFSVLGKSATEEITDELKEFLKKGDDVIYEEIRSFVQQHHITQTNIGNSSGSIPPGAAVAARPPCSAETVLTTCVPESFSTIPQRRERFTFRPCHLEVLERFFSVDQYPTAEKREEIAIACNQAVSSEVMGRELTEREKVYPHIVSNWFANRRKELKKIARDEGVDTSAVMMSGRGRWKSPSTDGSRLEPSPLSNDSDGQFQLDESDDQSLSMAVEVAAVNQAILSLTGQSHSAGIKPELLANTSVTFPVNHSDGIDL